MAAERAEPARRKVPRQDLPNRLMRRRSCHRSASLGEKAAAAAATASAWSGRSCCSSSIAFCARNRACAICALRSSFSARCRADLARFRSCLFRQAQLQHRLVPPLRPPTIRIRRGDKRVVLDGLGPLRGATAALVIRLAQTSLDAAGEGLTPEDYPCVASHRLAMEFGVTEQSLRRRVSPTRKAIAKLALDLGLDPPDDDAIVENFPWQAYRLNPDHVRVVDARAARSREGQLKKPR